MAARAVNDPRIRSYLATKQPIAGGPGSADDVAEAALYLCEPASRFVTGAELVVDGGWCVSEGTDGEAPEARHREGEAPSEPAHSLMSDRPDVLAQYLAAVRAAIDAIEATQLPAIREAAAQFAATILKGRLVHVFGTGHSRMAVEEMFPRYGSFPGFHPIVELSMTYHNPVVGANGQRQAMFLENVQGFGAGALAQLRDLARRRAPGHLDQRLQCRDDRCGAGGEEAGDVRRGPDFAGSRRRLDLAARVGPEAARGCRPGAGPAGPGRRLGRLGRRAGDAGRADFERHRLRDHQPGQGRGRPPAHRGRLAAQGLDRRVPSWVPSERASFSRKRTTITAAAWGCCIGRRRRRQIISMSSFWPH